MKTCRSGHEEVIVQSDSDCPVCELLVRLSDAINEIKRLTDKVRKLEGELGIDPTTE